MWLGKRRVEIMQLGRGHTKGDTVAWLPEEQVLFSGDLVEYGATPYTGDAYLTDWPATLERVRALDAEKLVPGRGEALATPRGRRRHPGHTRIRRSPCSTRSGAGVQRGSR